MDIKKECRFISHRCLLICLQVISSLQMQQQLCDSIFHCIVRTVNNAYENACSYQKNEKNRHDHNTGCNSHQNTRLRYFLMSVIIQYPKSNKQFIIYVIFN